MSHKTKRIKPLFWVYLLGFFALVWFLIRVIPKPSRASYPCQRAAFPMASAFVIWVTGVIGSLFSLRFLRKKLSQYKYTTATLSVVSIIVLVAWFTILPSNVIDAIAAEGDNYKPAIGFNWKPGASNVPIGQARGIFPGRVVMTRDAKATKWEGKWKLKEDQWWLDENTDTKRVANMLSVTLKELTGVKKDKEAWQKIFSYYNNHSRGLPNRGYNAGEVVAVKINLNNSSVDKKDNEIDATPQMVLAMVRQLVNEAGVPQENILVYDARRPIFPYMLTTVWNEFKDVRFMQEKPPADPQPVNPAYGDYTNFEGADWVDGIEYSAGNYNRAKLIPRQIKEATYIINMAILKLHSYPYNYMANGDEGQTAITMTGKNHCGSILGTSELHSILNTKKEGKKNAYSPLVDLEASPNLGAKTILFMLDGLYCGRKWRSYPIHFPNAPFNNKAEPYENPDWPACMLASFDGVAIQSVGLDIVYAQSKNNTEPDYYNVPRIQVRDNADDFLREMAIPENAPSGTKYMQYGKPVTSLGVFEHWNNDVDMQYSRNIDPVNGKGIEFIYVPILPLSPAELPGKGLSKFDFIYAGESKTLDIYKVKDGEVVWSYQYPSNRGEISDAVLMTNGNILIGRQFGISEISPDKQVVWNYDAPKGTEIHTAQPIGNKYVLFLQNGNPAKAIVVNKKKNKIVKEIELPVGNPKNIHGHFRHARLTNKGTLLVTHMDMGQVSEYDFEGNELLKIKLSGAWSAEQLTNGNILTTSRESVKEFDSTGKLLWKLSFADLPEYHITAPQKAIRLSNGNTIVNTWFNEWSGIGKPDMENLPVQAIEVTPEKEVVWALRSWEKPADLGPSTTIILLNEPHVNEHVSFGKFK